MNIQIAKIDNGWLVMTPPTPNEYNKAQQLGQQPQPHTKYCEDYDDVIIHIKQFFPPN